MSSKLGRTFNKLPTLIVFQGKIFSRLTQAAAETIKRNNVPATIQYINKNIKSLGDSDNPLCASLMYSYKHKTIVISTGEAFCHKNSFPQKKYQKKYPQTSLIYY